MASRTNVCTRRSRSMIEVWRRARIDPVSKPLILAAVEFGATGPTSADEVALVAKPGRAAPRDVIDDAHHADDDGRIDAGAAGVVVEAHVAAHHRDIEGSCMPR